MENLNRRQYYQKQTNGRCMVIVCVLLLVTAIYLLFTNASVKADTVTVQAEIADIEYLYAYGDKDGTEIEGVTKLTAIYEVDGVQMSAELEGGNPLWVAGDTIQIALDKDDPTAARYPASYALGLILLAGAVLSGVVATVCFVGVHKIKKWQHEMEEEERKRKLAEQSEQN